MKEVLFGTIFAAMVVILPAPAKAWSPGARLAMLCGGIQNCLGDSACYEARTDGDFYDMVMFYMDVCVPDGEE
jgi:hypothetical protein